MLKGFQSEAFYFSKQRMTTLQEDYNTQREKLTISEYGRQIQEYVKHIKSIANKDLRSRWAGSVVNVMATLNPDLRQQSNYKEKLWGHLFQIADYDLDVDCPYPVPTREERTKKPGTIGYFDSKIKFRFYGRNLQNMVDQVGAMEEGTLKQDLVNLIASFMYNSCKSWNNENLSNDVIAEHLKILSKGKLTPGGEDIVVSPDTSIGNQNQSQQRKFFKRSGGQGGQGGSKKGRFNRNNGGYRRH